jgi:hypothetical protein
VAVRYDRFNRYFLKSDWLGMNCNLQEELWDSYHEFTEATFGHDWLSKQQQRAVKCYDNRGEN